jgi:hypothetical protein
MAVMSKKPKQAGRPGRDPKSFKMVAVEIETRLTDAIDVAMASIRPKTTRRAIIETALEAWLTEQGYLDPESTPE